jgi:DNA-directed RNA polymerase subunit K/omega
LHAHPEQKELTVAEALALELPSLQPMLAPFNGFHETAHAVTGTCLISFDRNRYSVMARAARRAVQVRTYADRIVIRHGDEVTFRPRQEISRRRAALPLQSRGIRGAGCIPRRVMENEARQVPSEVAAVTRVFDLRRRSTLSSARADSGDPIEERYCNRFIPYITCCDQNRIAVNFTSSR